MASLADIPDAFLAQEHKPQLIEWLKLLPTTWEEKLRLLTLWSRFTQSTYTQDDVTEITSKGLLTNAR